MKIETKARLIRIGFWVSSITITIFGGKYVHSRFGSKAGRDNKT